MQNLYSILFYAIYYSYSDICISVYNGPNYKWVDAIVGRGFTQNL